MRPGVAVEEGGDDDGVGVDLDELGVPGDEGDHEVGGDGVGKLADLVLGDGLVRAVGGVCSHRARSGQEREHSLIYR